MKKDKISKLIEIKKELSAHPKFKGKAGMVRDVSDKLDFLLTHKTEPSLESLIIKEAEKTLKEAVNILSRA
jgi:hypothetical protein